MASSIKGCCGSTGRQARCGGGAQGGGAGGPVSLDAQTLQVLYSTAKGLKRAGALTVGLRATAGRRVGGLRARRLQYVVCLTPPLAIERKTPAKGGAAGGRLPRRLRHVSSGSGAFARRVQHCCLSTIKPLAYHNASSTKQHNWHAHDRQRFKGWAAMGCDSWALQPSLSSTREACCQRPDHRAPVEQQQPTSPPSSVTCRQRHLHPFQPLF